MNTTLSKEFLNELASRLRHREEELVRELSAGQQRAASENFRRIAGEAPDNSDASLADLIVDSATAERTRDSEELRDVQDALTRIEAGAYGLCQECGEAIELERLKVNPAARYDLKHQKVREQDRIRTPTL
jgi:RNA polymerase-binding transcription factor